MSGYAIVDRSKRGPGSVLMILDDREEAEAIAFELHRNQVEVAVIEIPDQPPGDPEDTG